MRTSSRTTKPIVNYFVVYLIFYSFIAVLINHFTYPTQGVNDDEFFAQLVSGEFTGQRESFMHISPASPQWSFGFVPKLPLMRILSARNVAGEGAKMVLLSQSERMGASTVVEEIEYVELSDRSDFNDKIIEQLAFPV